MRCGGNHAFPMDRLRAGDLCTACYPDGFSDDDSYNCHDQGRTQNQHENVSDPSDGAAGQPTGNH